MNTMQLRDLTSRRNVTFGHILVAADATPISEATLDYALDLARRMKASLELLTVIGQVQGDAYSPIRYSPEAMAEHSVAEDLVRDSLQEMVSRQTSGDVSIKVHVQKGQPISTIVAWAKRTEADLLVVGTHERGRIARHVIRSAAEELVRKSPCSVLVIHETDRPASQEPRRILVPIDMSDASEHQLHLAAELAEAYDAELEIIHVVEPVPLMDSFAGALTIGDLGFVMRRESEADIRALADRIDWGDLQWKLIVDEGHAASRILEQARMSNSDLIVVGRQGRSAVERFFMGSVAERVVRHAACPVLVAAR